MSVRVDINAVRACALLVWRGLTDAQRSALRRASPSYGCDLAARGHGRAIAALHRLGLATMDSGPSPLTLVGKLVREVGLDDDAAAARRRYAKRRRMVKPCS